MLALVDKIFPDHRERDIDPKTVQNSTALDQSVPSEDLALKQQQIDELRKKIQLDEKTIQELHEEIEKAGEYPTK